MLSYLLTRLFYHLLSRPPTPQPFIPLPPSPRNFIPQLSIPEQSLTEANFPYPEKLWQELSSSSVRFTIEFPSSPHGLPFNLRYAHFLPAVIIIPRNVEEVQEALVLARCHGIKVSARCGGHSYAAHGIGGESGAMVLDMERFKDCFLDEDNDIAMVGAGTRLGDLAYSLWELGGKAIPHGSCPAVGLAGHSLLGGFGHASRMWGLAVDSILEMTCVLWDGQIVTASQTENEDLYWALRGAGPSFAIVTEFKILTRDVPDENIIFIYNYRSLDPKILAMAHMLVYEFGKFDALDTHLSIGVHLGITGSFVVRGVFYGHIDDFRLLVDALVVRLDQIFGPEGTENKSVQVLGWIQHLQEMAGSVPLRINLQIKQEGGYFSHDCFYAKSLVQAANSSMTEGTLERLFSYLVKHGQNSPFSWFIICNLYGGPPGFSRISDPYPIPASTSSYSHRDALFVWQFYASCDETQDHKQAVGPFVNGMVEALIGKLEIVPEGWGAYPGYIDAEMAGSVAREAYYGENGKRLQMLKRKFDPKNLFSGGGLGLEV